MHGKKRFYLLALLAALAVPAWLLSPYLLRTAFRVSGTVRMGPETADRALKPNTMLFIVARNEGGIPFAVRKVINPSFPLRYAMGPSDLLLPELLPLRVRLEAFLNTHGEIGAPRKGDLYGSLDRRLFFVSKEGDLLLDREH